MSWFGLSSEEQKIFSKLSELIEVKCEFFVIGTSNEELARYFLEVRQEQKNTDVNKLADFIYKKYYAQRDNIKYFAVNATNQDKTNYLAKKSNYEVNRIYCQYIVRSLDGDVNKIVELAKSGKIQEYYDSLSKNKSQSQISTNATSAKPVTTPTKPVVQQPRPTFISTGNKDFDGLLILRANMSCVYGYARAKAKNIKANTDLLNRTQQASGKDYKEYNDRKYDVDNAIAVRDGNLKAIETVKQMIEKYKHFHPIKKSRCKKMLKRDLDLRKKYDNDVVTAQKAFDTLCKNKGEKWTKQNNTIAKCKELIDADYKDIQKAFSDFEKQTFCILKNDYKYVDYLIYLFESHRATTLKEALNELDNMVRHNELMNAINRLSANITQSINGLSKQIYAATASINANISYMNSNICSVNQNISNLRQEVSSATNEIISQQISTQSLIAEGNRIASMNYEATKSAASTLDSIRTRLTL